jgi:hypothetical protein
MNTVHCITYSFNRCHYKSAGGRTRAVQAQEGRGAVAHLSSAVLAGEHAEEGAAAAQMASGITRPHHPPAAQDHSPVDPAAQGETKRHRKQ